MMVFNIKTQSFPLFHLLLKRLPISVLVIVNALDNGAICSRMIMGTKGFTSKNSKGHAKSTSLKISELSTPPSHSENNG